MTDKQPTSPKTGPNYLYLAAFTAALVVLVNYANETDAFSEPSTFVGIAVGLALGAAAWIIGRRVQR